MNGSWAMTLSTIFISLLVVPGGLTYYLLKHGPPEENSSRMVTVGLIALLPGVLMGAGALWVAAHD